ncbi:MAG: flavin reductase [Nocardioidaceae bacterium]
MTIHSGNPFADPEPDPVRQLRGRLGGQVTLWTAGSGADRAGLTVSSLLVAVGEPGRVVGLLDPDSDFAARFEQTRRAVICLLEWPHRMLAEIFAGLAPSPGGPFAAASFEQTPFGPRLVSTATWCGVRLLDGPARAETVGWSWLVDCAIEELHVGPETDPLLHRRGRYTR